MNIEQKYIERARDMIAAQCDRQDMGLRAHLYRTGGNDEQPELRALARFIRDCTPRPLHELLAEDEATIRITAKK